MTTATASLPRTAGNGAALVVVAADFVFGLLEKAMTPKAANEVKAAVQATTVEKAGSFNVWELYRAGGESDSLSPKAAALLQKVADAN